MLPVVFPFLDFAAGELPTIFEFTIAPLVSKDLVVVGDDGSDYFDGLHGLDALPDN